MPPSVPLRRATGRRRKLCHTRLESRSHSAYRTWCRARATRISPASGRCAALTSPSEALRLDKAVAATGSRSGSLLWRPVPGRQNLCYSGPAPKVSCAQGQFGASPDRARGPEAQARSARKREKATHDLTLFLGIGTEVVQCARNADAGGYPASRVQSSGGAISGLTRPSAKARDCLSAARQQRLPALFLKAIHSRRFAIVIWAGKGRCLEKQL